MKPGLIEGLQMIVPDIEKADGNKGAVQRLPQRG